MVPGAFRTVIPFFTARPERGRTCPSSPRGISRCSPVGISARCPGFRMISCGSSARTSAPDAPSDWYSGSAPRPPAQLTTGASISVRICETEAAHGGHTAAAVGKEAECRFSEALAGIVLDRLRADLAQCGDRFVELEYVVHHHVLADHPFHARFHVLAGEDHAPHKVTLRITDLGVRERFFQEPRKLLVQRRKELPRKGRGGICVDGPHARVRKE